MLSVMLYHCILCVALLMGLFACVLRVVWIAICLGVVVCFFG